MDNRFEKKLKKFILDQGVDLVGFANVERFEEAPEGNKPQDLLPKAKSVITVAKHIPDGIVDSLPSPSYQAQGYLILSEMLNEIGFHIAAFLEKYGFKSIAIPASYNDRYSTVAGEWPNLKIYKFSNFSHRHAAEKTGLGRIGRNNLLITPEYGPRVRLQSTITTVPLEPDPMIEEEICTCKRCLPLERCPSKALSEYTTDHYKCVRSQEIVMDESDPDFERRDREFAQRFIDKANQHPLESSAALLGHTDYGATCCGVCLRECVIGVISAKKRLK